MVKPHLAAVPRTSHRQPSPVEEMPAPATLAVLGLQHVLVMYAGAIAVPLIVGRALKLAPEQVAALISADLFCCGLATLIQALGLGKWFGIRLPVMMGVTFASVGPMLAMANEPQLGLGGIFGAVIGAGLVAIVIAPLMSRILALFPPVVTGSIIVVIGVSLMPVGINWVMGGPPGMALIANPAAPASLMANPAYGALDNLGISLFVLLVISLVAKLGRGFLSNIAVLVGIVAGTALAFFLGKVDFAKVASAKAFAIVTPFQFGWPSFDVVAILTMSLVMVVVMIESLGMFLALGELTGKRLAQADLARGLRADGLGTLLGGIFNTFPYTSFSQNIGLVGVSGVRSRWVCVAAGAILIVMGVLPKLAQAAKAIPSSVLGGAALVMFGMVAATGIRILAGVNYMNQRNNLFVVALALGFGMLPLAAENYAQHLPKALAPLMHSGIVLAALAAVLLNLYFNGIDWEEDEAARDKQ
ncbi:xanthine permease [Oxalobacteraceae bacterium GrIS 1.11]